MIGKREIKRMEARMERNKEAVKKAEDLGRYLWLRRQKDRKCNETG